MGGCVAKIQAAEPMSEAVDSPPALNRVIIIASAVNWSRSPVADAVARSPSRLSCGLVAASWNSSAMYPLSSITEMPAAVSCSWVTSLPRIGWQHIPPTE